MKVIATFALLFSLFLSAEASIFKREMTGHASQRQQERVLEAKQRVKETELNPQTWWFTTVVDHFDTHGAGGPTWEMRYLIDMTYWDEVSGPIIFYAGNEGDIWTFFENSGFMTTTLAQHFSAITVFAEHRYFGESMPFGEDSFENENLPYLTVE